MERIEHYRVKELASELGCSTRTVYRRIHDGLLPGAFKMKGLWYIDKKAVREFLKKNASKEGPTIVNEPDPTGRHGLT